MAEVAVKARKEGGAIQERGTVWGPGREWGRDRMNPKLWAWIPWDVGVPRTKVEMVEGAPVWGGVLGAMSNGRPEGGLLELQAW